MNWHSTGYPTIGNSFKKERKLTIISSSEPKVTSSKDLGQKELAYEIKNHKTGFYFLVNIEANDSKAIDEFNRLALISEDVIRHLIVKEEK